MIGHQIIEILRRPSYRVYAVDRAVARVSGYDAATVVKRYRVTASIAGHLQHMVDRTQLLRRERDQRRREILGMDNHNILPLTSRQDQTGLNDSLRKLF